MLRRLLSVLIPAGALVASAIALPGVSASGVAPAATPPYGDANLVSMFNGTDLTGWTASAAGEYVVTNSAIHSTGKDRGWIYYNKQQVGSFRWIFTERQYKNTGAAHEPDVLFWGTTDPIRDALSALQFRPPNGQYWDYRPGHNDDGNGEFTQYPHTAIPTGQWTTCEVIGDQTTGTAQMACGGVKVVSFKDATAGRVGPLAIQTHNSGIQDEYKDLYVESPVTYKPGQFITGTASGGGGGEVHAVGADKCLDVPGGTTTAATQVETWGCNGGAGQLWTHTTSKQLTVYGGADCLDAASGATAPGTKVQIWPCNGGANQQWNVNSNGTITSAQSGLCLDVANKSTAQGAPIDIWTCNSGSNQQWTLN
jgi:hypothetical protein